MRTFSIISTCVMLFASLGLVSSADAQWPQTTAHNPWSLEFGAKALERKGSDLFLPLVTDTVTLDTLFDSTQANDLGTAPAAEVKFNFQTRDGQELEVRSILANWDESIESIVGPNIDSPLFPTIVSNEPFTFDLFSYEHDSDLYSLEVMHRKSVHPGVVCMFGPRIVSTKDFLKTTTDATVTPTGGVASTITTENTIDATNILMGLQGGLEINRPIFDGIYFSSFLRVGGYYNPTEVTYTTTDNFSSTVDTQVASQSTGSFLGETGGRVYCDIVPNCFSAYAGYEATWIDGIAQAPPQLYQDATGMPRDVETANTVFFQGVTFGLKLTY